jgi:fermentation-respiration switch protein FrsA (DUF1100 family)
VLVAALVLAAVWAGQRRLIYFPFRNVPPPADAGLRLVEEVSFPTEDGLTLHGWFVPPVSGSASITILVFNGNAGNRGMRGSLAQAFAARGIATFLFDYRGYGENRGTPSESGLVRDARAARAYLDGRPDVDPRRVVYFGESLGAAVAVHLAVEAAPAALVLRSPFTSLTDIGRHHYPFLPVRWLLRDRYPSIELIPRVSAPVLVIAGDRDRVIPVEQSRALFAAAPQPRELVIIERANHNDEELFSGPRVVDAVVDFVSRVR